MSRFYVGQRVRLVRSSPIRHLVRHPIPLGTEGRIVALRFQPAGTPVVGGGFLFRDSDVVVDYQGDRRSGHTDQLEPITPPHVAGSWEVIEQLLPNIREGVAA